MRYLIIYYYKKPNGQMDEVAHMSQRIKPRDLATAAVIIDFKTQTVGNCSMGDVVVPRDWTRVRDFYHQYYAQVIDDLEKINSEKNDTD